MSNFESELKDKVAIIRPSGRLDAYTSPELETWLNEVTVPTVIMNLAEVNFVDTHVISLLVQTMKRCRERGGELILCALARPVRIILELMRLDLALTIVESEDAILT